MNPGQELEGINVVSIDQAVAAPYCSLLLADAGARVIKVERPEGDFARGYDKSANGHSVIFAWLNRGKESIALDLNREADVALLHKMLASADVFLHNLAPGALVRRGFSGEFLRKTNPALITCEISGYGNTGKAANKKAYDFLVQAEAGLCSVTGTEQNPSRVGISICDISSGLTAFSAILRALIGRSKTNKGCDIAISMFDVIADWMNMPLVSSRYMGGAPGRLGLTHALIAPYGAFSCKNNAQILIAIQSNREWCVFCAEILQQAPLGEDARFRNNVDRVTNRQALHAIVNEVFGRYDVDQLVMVLDQAKIANARLSDVDGLSNHEFLRNLSVQFGTMDIELADLPVPGARPLQVPMLNQHGDALRQEFLT